MNGKLFNVPCEWVVCDGTNNPSTSGTYIVLTQLPSSPKPDLRVIELYYKEENKSWYLSCYGAQYDVCKISDERSRLVKAYCVTMLDDDVINAYKKAVK